MDWERILSLLRGQVERVIQQIQEQIDAPKLEVVEVTVRRLHLEEEVVVDVLVVHIIKETVDACVPHIMKENVVEVLVVTDVLWERISERTGEGRKYRDVNFMISKKL